MNEPAAANGGDIPIYAAPIAENEHVKELLGILEDNGKDAPGLAALLGHVSEMESFVKRAEGKIADMKAQLDTMKEMQDHPIRTKLQKTIHALETAVEQVKKQLAELKTNIVEGCKNAVAAFKEKGAEALDRLASFFKIKGGLQAIKNGAVKAADNCDKALSNIDAFSKEYHNARRHVKNMARMMVGKKPIDAAKESGKLAKAAGAPYRAHKACMNGIRAQATKMITSLEKLEQRAEINQAAAKAKKPTLMERLDEKKNEIKQRELDKPPQERARAPRAQGLEV